MKKSLAILATCVVATCGFAADGAQIYKQCVACHGKNAEKVYLNKVPALSTLEPATMLEQMKGYKAGTIGEGGKGLFKQGAIMKMQMAKLSEEDMKAVIDYIQTLKK